MAPERIERYLYNWTNELFDEENTAYENDEFPYGDAWQVVDFLRALGFHYPEQQLSNTINRQMPTLLEIVEQNIPPLAEEQALKEYALIDKLLSAFSNEYIRHLLIEEGVCAFGFEHKTPQDIINTISVYCSSVKRAESDTLCQ